MGRRSKLDGPTKIQFYVPASIMDKINAELYSELEGKVPYGALSDLGARLFMNWLRERGIPV